MKKLFLLLIAIIAFNGVWAQATDFGPMYLHRSSGSNCYYTYTLLNPLMVGADPIDKLIITHVYGTPEGSHAAYMLNSCGLWYTGFEWSIFDEAEADFDTNYAFFVLNAKNNGTAFTHTVTVANTVLNWTVIDHPSLNNNPNAVFFVTKTWENSIYDVSHVGVWYDAVSNKWTIYDEDPLNALGLDLTFNIFIPNSGTTFFKHVASDTYYVTTLDHPLLNGNPDARLFVVHDYTTTSGTQGYINDEIGVWYDGNNWNIYTENFTDLFIGATFNVLIAYDVTAGLKNPGLPTDKLHAYPSPATDQVTLSWNTETTGKVEKILLASLDGRVLMQQSITGGSDGQYEMNTSNLRNGLYFLSIVSAEGVQTVKIQVIH
ncbi:MAG: T9SS type A sorting domain-containing protein [Bacteroidetes bacterium]|nr:T9SS type A sorting domain-containing protein [Bacteroidota bacterium]